MPSQFTTIALTVNNEKVGDLDRTDNWKGKKKRKKRRAVQAVAMLAREKKVDMRRHWHSAASAKRNKNTRSRVKSVFGRMFPY